MKVTRAYFSLSLSPETVERLADQAERRRERELVERARHRKVPVSYQQRMAAAQKGR